MSSAHVIAAARPAPPPAQTYSIILEPTGEVSEVAQREIDRLAEEYGGRSVPAHVTLMAGIVDSEEGILDRGALLSSQLRKQKVTVTGVIVREVKVSGVPHRSVALSLKGELPFGVAGALAHPAYVRHPVLPKVAHLHLSLLYSSSLDAETGERIVKDLEGRLLAGGPLEWTAEELKVVDTSGDDPAKWPVLRAFPLQDGADV